MGSPFAEVPLTTATLGNIQADSLDGLGLKVGPVAQTASATRFQVQARTSRCGIDSQRYANSVAMSALKRAAVYQAAQPFHTSIPTVGSENLHS
jgi:hypothetical protein